MVDKVKWLRNKRVMPLLAHPKRMIKRLSNKYMSKQKESYKSLTNVKVIISMVRRKMKDSSI